MAGVEASIDGALLEEGALDAGAEPLAAVSPQAARLSGKATTAASAAILVAEDLRFMSGLSRGVLRSPCSGLSRC